MKYNGIKVKEFKSDKSLVFDPPKLMFVRDDDDGVYTDTVVAVYAYIPKRRLPVISRYETWRDCAEVPGTVASQT